MSDRHPTPWRVNKIDETRADVLDAKDGCVIPTYVSPETAEEIVNAVNSNAGGGNTAVELREIRKAIDRLAKTTATAALLT